MSQEALQEFIKELPKAVSLGDFGTDNHQPIYQIKAFNKPGTVLIAPNPNLKPDIMAIGYLMPFIEFGLKGAGLQFESSWDYDKNRAVVSIDTNDENFALKATKALYYVENVRQVYGLGVENWLADWMNQLNFSPKLTLFGPLLDGNKGKQENPAVACITLKLTDPRLMGEAQTNVVPGEMIYPLNNLKTILVEVGIPPEEIKLRINCYDNPKAEKGESKFVYYFDFTFLTQRLLDLQPGQFTWRMRTAKDEEALEPPPKEKPSGFEL